MRTQKFQWSSLSVGTCYYPEHWDEALWAGDLQKMQRHHISTIRIGEFAWCFFEPREGEYDFSLFDRFMALVEKTPIHVIFGTPTATPPAWLTEKYPEVLNAKQDGTLYRHGMRRHYNYNSPVYLEKCANIVRRLAERYGSHPSIIGWQIDNELNCEMSDFYSQADDAAFRDFLKEKYTDVDALNHAWGTAFWSQRYSCWEEVHLPRPVVFGEGNPHQRLDYFRFISASAIRFAALQSEILHQYAKPGDFITTNGMFGRLDNHRLMDEVLDVYTYDSYPNFAFELCADPKHSATLNDRRWSEHLMQVRSICLHFGIMEQQSGAMGWNTRMEAPAPKPGQQMLWAMQSIAHGADFVSFFRFRTACFGTEMYWHGLYDYDNRENRKLRELDTLCNRLPALQCLTGSEYKAVFAVLRDVDNVFDSEIDHWHGRLAWKSEEEIWAASQLTHTPMDMLYMQEDTQTDDLLRYPVLIAPHMEMVTEKQAVLLKSYVEKGGTLVIGARTGQKNGLGHCVMMPMPGLLGELSHTTVDDFTFVGPADDEVTLTWNDKTLSAGVFTDVLQPTDEQAMVLARYDNNYYAGSPALTESRYGQGRVIHFGGTFTRGFAAALLKYLGIATPWAASLSLPEECELSVREKDGKRWFMVLNYADHPVTVTLHRVLENTETGEKLQGEQTLPAYGTLVLTDAAEEIRI